jgi:leader peptidase (prepilin peptidase)/N-methyltransferase
MKPRSLAAAGALIFGTVAAVENAGAARVAQLSLTGATLAAAAAWDLAERRIPNRLTVPVALTLLALLAATDAKPGGLAGGLAASGVLFGLALVRPAALGMGDAKLALVLALGLSDKALVGLASGVLLAAIFAAGRIARSSGAGAVAVPLGPFLAFGALIALLV